MAAPHASAAASILCRIGTLALVVVATGACSSSESSGNTASDAGSGGAGAGSGGLPSSAGASSTAGTTTGTAGSTGKAGGTSLGGATSAGGRPGSGGTASSGGSPSTGGSGTSTGGATSAGGNPGSGGTLGTGGEGAGGTGGSSTLVNPAPGSKFFVGTNFWNIDWEGQDDFFQSGVNFATTTNPWKSELLADLAPYHVLRFMDWNQTNNSNNAQAVWNTRKQKTAAQNEPVAFEWQIDLCNRTKTDYWLNVPHESTPDYWTKLAGLVKDQLDPTLRVYVEWSNEVWNAGFPQNGYADGKAKSMGLAGSIPASSYYVYASVRMYEAFEAVFGKGSPRLVKVLAGQAAWNGPCDAHMLALKDATINPNGTKPNFYAIAPYFGGTSIAALTSNIPTVTGWTTEAGKCATAGSVPLISYEGGSDSFSAPSNGCVALQHDAAMHDLYMTYLTGLSGAGMKGPFMQYTHTGSCWGLKEKTGDSLATSPKYKGVVDWLAAHP